VALLGIGGCAGGLGGSTPPGSGLGGAEPIGGVGGGGD
jgi:hypothetical protein